MGWGVVVAAVAVVVVVVVAAVVAVAAVAVVVVVVAAVAAVEVPTTDADRATFLAELRRRMVRRPSEAGVE